MRVLLKHQVAVSLNVEEMELINYALNEWRTRQKGGAFKDRENIALALSLSSHLALIVTTIHDLERLDSTAPESDRCGS